MNYYNEIKNKLVNNEIYKRVKDYSKNKNELQTYYEVGKLLVEAGKHYGDGVIKKYSKKLISELNTKYDVSYLNKMRKFYMLIEKMATVSPNLSYSHYVELLPYDDIDKIKYYVRIVEENNLSVRDLRRKIKSNEYERLPEPTRNKLIKQENVEIQDLVKDPIIIKNTLNKEKISEKVLQQLILDDIVNFMKELGNGFSFIANEYKIKIGKEFNYIDLLFFNIKYNCYIVCELKVTDLKKEHIGQTQVYMNYIDKNLRSITQDKTIGIIIVAKDNKYIIEYCSDKRIFSTSYKLI